MGCIDEAGIRRYVQGMMSDLEADEVTGHLVSCKRCRQAVAEARGTTDPQRAMGAVPEQHQRADAAVGAPELVKVRCQQCNARYGIPADRVRGRMLKIRCKKCSSIIEVKSPDESARSVIDRGKKLWFLVIKRQRVGPMTEQEVRERFERREVKAKTYAWRRGFAKWERLRDISEFSDLGRGGDLTPTPRVTADMAPETTRPAAPSPELLRGGASDPGRTENARPPGAGQGVPRERSISGSEDLDFDQRRHDSMAKTAYRPSSASAADSDDSLHDSAVRTAYLPEGAPPAGEAQVTHIHLARREDPLDGLEHGGEMEQELTSKYDAESQASWDKQFSSDPSVPVPARPNPRLQDGEWDQRMKGQRRESSVLFSLAHLRDLAGSSAPAARKEERSSAGLFDIKPTLGPPASALLMPEEPPRRPRGAGLILFVAALGVVLGAAVLLGLFYLVQPDLVRALIAGKPVKVVTAGEARDAGTLVASAAAAVDAQPQRAQLDAAPPTGVPDAAATSPDAGSSEEARPDAAAPPPPRVRRDRRAASHRARRKHRRKKKPSIEVVDPDVAEGVPDEVEPEDGPPPEPPAEEKPPAAKKKPAKGGAELDRLIDDATGPGEIRKKPAQPPQSGGQDGAGAAAKLPRTLTREQVAAGMKLANPGVHACYEQFREPGLVMISATINGASGRISSARVVGGFAGTPAGQCVLQIVRSLCVFPRFSGPPLTLKYPFMLR